MRPRCSLCVFCAFRVISKERCLVLLRTCCSLILATAHHATQMHLRTVLLFLRVKHTPGIIYGIKVESLDVKKLVV
jgi:hypothetical protein